MRAPAEVYRSQAVSFRGDPYWKSYQSVVLSPVDLYESRADYFTHIPDCQSQRGPGLKIFCILRGCQSSRAEPLHQESICVHLEH